MENIEATCLILCCARHLLQGAILCGFPAQLSQVLQGLYIWWKLNVEINVMHPIGVRVSPKNVTLQAYSGICGLQVWPAS